MKRTLPALALIALALSFAAPARAAAPAAKPASKPASKTEAKSPPHVDTGTFAGLTFRSIGPAAISGRVTDIAVDPQHPRRWFITTAYSGVWRTENAGTDWTPVFDNEGTPSIGCVALDPSDPMTVWVGSGENNSQRSVGWGDGVYRSTDGGRTWKNMGLKASEHIGMIAVDPRHSNVVFVAAQGPLWAPGGDRGLYKSSDGGKTWKQVLKVDDWTGANEVRFDPRNPDVMYASTYQRHRKVWTLVDGGPGSGLWKSTDAGETWTKLTSGLPTEDMGRIGFAVSALEPGVIVATIEAANDAGGTYRSRDAGANWEKLNGQISTSPQYYQEVWFDPSVPGRLYMDDTFLQTSDDGGRTWHRAGEKNKHVDNHAVWVDPADSNHLLVGCDGGLYETFDRCASWNWFANLPLAQFYRVDVDNDTPFYYVYGGTQDNNSLGGPSRTTNTNGIRNSDWFVTVGGDGFFSRCDPEDPNTVYAEWQDGHLVRFDRKTGGSVDVQPQPAPGEPADRFNWDSPVLVSPHLHTRLYFASQRVFRSDDRGQSWKPVSPDLSRGLDRNRLKEMGRVWGVDAVAKNASTSPYGAVVSLDESPLQEGLLVAGTDDGLVQVSEDGGAHWRRFDAASLVGEYPYVSKVLASRHSKTRLYAEFERHKMGDFKPYVYVSEDLGKSWRNISGDLPATDPVYSLVEDTKDPQLLFAGTEFGLYMTQDGGRKWVRLKSGLPMQAIRDLTIQRRDDDLVVATFGRGFWILDDLSPLRSLHDADLASDARLLTPRKALMYVQGAPLGGSGNSFQGDRFYEASNPAYGATFTYWLKSDLKSRKDARRAKEKEIAKSGGDTFYPSWDSLRAEAREDKPAIVLTVTDEQGNVVRRLDGPTGSGFHRVAWDFRYPSMEPASLTPRVRPDFADGGDGGPIVPPGTYRVQLSKRVDGKVTPLGEPQAFTCVALANETLPPADRAAVAAFQGKVGRLQRAALGTGRALGDARTRVQLLEKALDDTPAAPTQLRSDALAIENRLRDLAVTMYGDPVVQEANEPTPPGLMDRVNQVVFGAWDWTGDPTATHVRNVEIASAELEKTIAGLKTALSDLGALEARAEAAGAPWTPGRVPEWKPE